METNPNSKTHRSRAPFPADLFPAEPASPREMRALGCRLAARLAPGAVVACYGDLGAGKTQFAKGVAGGLGISERSVRSPTFVVAREYEGRWPEGHPQAGAAVPFFHLDAYRLDGPAGLAAVDTETYFFGEGVCLVEWPQRLETLLPAGALRLRLEHLSAERRRVALASEQA